VGFLFSQIFDVVMDNHPQDDLAKFGYRVERFVVLETL